MRILTGAHLFLPPVRSPSGWCHLWTGSASPALPVYRKQPVREAELCLNQIQSVWLLLTKLKARCSVRVRACVRRAPKQQILPQFLLLKLQLSLIWSLLHSDTCWWLVEFFYAAILPSESCVFKPVSLCVCFLRISIWSHRQNLTWILGSTSSSSSAHWDSSSHLFPFVSILYSTKLLGGKSVHAGNKSATPGGVERRGCPAASRPV